VGRIRLIYV
jgi:hypothetical protein